MAGPTCLLAIAALICTVGSVSISRAPVATRAFNPFTTGVSSGSTSSQTPVSVSIPTCNPILKSPIPWTSSICAGRELSYMPMLNAQLELMREMGMEQVQLEEKFVYRGSEVKPARIGSLEFRSERFRKVRMTYIDGGDAIQVFNTLWYPSYELDAPLLGVDLISLGANRVLSVIDFQPLHPTEDYSRKYIDHMAPVRNKYPDLHGVLSGKIYDDTSFFSKQMLFGRFKDESKVSSVVLPAFTEYLKSYVDMVGQSSQDFSEKAKSSVHQRQKDYDTYSAKKDPAVGLFDAYFGKEWSSDFVHNFLFQHSEHSDAAYVHNFSIDSNGQVHLAAASSAPQT